MDGTVGSDSKESACGTGDQGSVPWVKKISWSRKWQPTPVFLPGELHGQRSLVGYSPWGHKELDTTEWLILSFLFPYKMDKKIDSAHSILNDVCKYSSSLFFLTRYRTEFHLPFEVRRAHMTRTGQMDVSKVSYHSWGEVVSAPACFITFFLSAVIMRNFNLLDAPLS